MPGPRPKPDDEDKDDKATTNLIFAVERASLFYFFCIVLFIGRHINALL